MVEWAFLWHRTWQEFLLLLKAPAFVPEMWWIITPLILMTLLMTFYFGRYVEEKLGWNTALGNSVVLFFVGIDLLRTIYHYSAVPSWLNLLEHPVKICVIVFVMFEGVLLSYTAFRHALPEKLMFFIASPLPVNVQAYVLTSAVYMQIVPTWYTLLAALLLFAILFIALKTLQEIEHLRFKVHSKKKK